MDEGTDRRTGREVEQFDEPSLIWEGRGMVRKASAVVMHRATGLKTEDHKLFNYLLNRAYFKLRTDPVHRIPVRDAIDYLGGNANIDTINESLKRLGAVHVEIDYEEITGEKRHASMHFLSFDTSIAMSGILSFSFDQVMLKFLHEPKIYAQLSLKDVRNFKTLAGERLYEKMMLHHKRTFDKAWSPKLEELYEFCGVPPGTRLDNFKERVIEPAVNEVNENAPFGVKVEYDGGRGRRTNFVTFTIVQKSHQDMMSPARLGSSRGSKLPQDSREMDLFDGKTAADRGGSIVIGKLAYEEAEELVQGTSLDIDDIERRWRDLVDNRRVKDPDQQFLNWVALQVEKAKGDADLARVNDDIIDDLLG